MSSKTLLRTPSSIPDLKLLFSFSVGEEVFLAGDACVSAAAAIRRLGPDAGAMVRLQIEPGPATASDLDVSAWRQPRLRTSLQLQLRRRDLCRQRFSFSGHLHLVFFLGKPKGTFLIMLITKILLPGVQKVISGVVFFLENLPRDNFQDIKHRTIALFCYLNLVFFWKT